MKKTYPIKKKSPQNMKPYQVVARPKNYYRPYVLVFGLFLLAIILLVVIILKAQGKICYSTYKNLCLTKTDLPCSPEGIDEQLKNGNILPLERTTEGDKILDELSFNTGTWTDKGFEAPAKYMNPSKVAEIINVWIDSQPPGTVDFNDIIFMPKEFSNGNLLVEGGEAVNVVLDYKRLGTAGTGVSANYSIGAKDFLSRANYNAAVGC